MYNATEIIMRLEAVQSLDSDLKGAFQYDPLFVGSDSRMSADTLWLLLAAFLVFFMQAGFAMLEVGSVSSKNAKNILLKNLMDVSLGGIFYWALGWGFSYGGSNPFIGGTEFFMIGTEEYRSWLFQFAFAATAATIVSGSVAERTQFRAYFIYSIFLTAFIYPVVVHWVWSTDGFLSAFNSDSASRIGGGMMDFAGSGVVHMTGGTAALVGAIAVGARHGRFDKATGKPQPKPGHNPVLAALGGFILWFGWYGFNAGSTLIFTGGAQFVAGKVAVTTTLAACGGGLTVLFIGRLATKSFDLSMALNGILAGLVSITAGCSVVDPWSSVLIGIIGGIVYFGFSRLLLRLKIDDPLDASPIHCFCGFWGVLSVGLFATPENVMNAYATDSLSNIGVFFGGDGTLFGVQLLGGIIIFCWTALLSSLVFFPLKKLRLLRVTAEVEDAGLDVHKHGGSAYPQFMNIGKNVLSVTMSSSQLADDKTQMPIPHSSSFRVRKGAE